MLKKKLNKIVWLEKEQFDLFVQEWQIQIQEPRLIPTLKTGDEMALTSIFLSWLRLVKEYKNTIFKDFKLTRAGSVYYYTEAFFLDIDKNVRIDWLIIIVIKWIITDAIFLEMKNKNNPIEEKQIEKYLQVSKKLWISKLITISNQFVPDSSHSPINLRVPKNILLLHFSWTYLLTRAHLLLFKNNDTIKDEDQIFIMRELLYYMENPVSGVLWYTQMKPWWKELAESVRAKKSLKSNDKYIQDSILSWYEEEKDIALIMSRKLGVLVKSSSKTKESLKKDVTFFIKNNYIKGLLNIKNSVSDIKIISDFERRNVSMSVKILPPLDKWTVARITWIWKQLEKCEWKNEKLFKYVKKDIWIEANIKYAQENIKINLLNLDKLDELTKWKEINEFKIVFIKDFWRHFSSNKKFVEIIEKMVLDYYESIVQHITSWDIPTPKIIK